MLIGDKYKVESDELNITLFKKRVSKKSSKVQWGIIGFFSSVKEVLKFLVNLEVRESTLKDLETINERIDKLFGLIKSLELVQDKLREVGSRVKGSSKGNP